MKSIKNMKNASTHRTSSSFSAMMCLPRVCHIKKYYAIISNLLMFHGQNSVQKKATSMTISALDSARKFISHSSQSAYCNASINIALILSAVKLKH